MTEKRKWYRGKWETSAEIAPLVMEIINKVTRRGIEVKEEGNEVSFFSYHPAHLWEKERASLEVQVELLLSLFPDAQIKCDWEEFYEENWQENWRQYFRPQRISKRLIVLPAWEKYSPQKGEIALFIEPAMAFGTGTHETTRLCLKSMEALYPLETPQSMLDVGTGTGILAIYAAKFGIRHITALDTDPLAIEAASKNAALNKVSHLRFVQDTVNPEVGQYDWVVANLETKIILPLLNALTQIANKTLILSGILTGEIEKISSVLDRPPRKCLTEGEWACLII